MKSRPPRTRRSRICATALVLAAASTTLVHGQTFNFTAAEGFIDASLDGQQGWVANTATGISNSVDSTAGTVTSQNGSYAVYDTPFNLTLGETLNISATFQFADFDASGLVPPAMGEFWYMVRLGLQETNDTTMSVGIGTPGGSTRLQALDGDVRLLDAGFGPGTTGTTGAAIALGTIYTIDYTLTMGSDETSTTMDVSLSDGTNTISGVITGISASLFADLASGDGAYPFFESDLPVQGGIEASQLLSFSVSTGAPVFTNKVWVDNDPLSGISVTAGGLSVTNDTPPDTTGHPTAGLVDHSASTPFSNINPGGPIAITPAEHGQDFTFEVDYFVPVGTVMDADDTLYVQMNFNSAANASTGGNLSAGFIGAAQAGTGWNTITLSGTVPATDDYPVDPPNTPGPGNPVDEVVVSIIFVDGGFSGTPDQASGTSLYVDDICFAINTTTAPTPPPPSGLEVTFDFTIGANDWSGNVDSISTNGLYHFSNLADTDPPNSFKQIMQLTSGQNLTMFRGVSTLGPITLSSTFTVQDAADVDQTFVVTSLNWFNDTSVDTMQLGTGTGTSRNSIVSGYSGGAGGTLEWQLTGDSAAATLLNASSANVTTGSLSAEIDTIVWETPNYFEENFGSTIDNLSIVIPGAATSAPLQINSITYDPNNVDNEVTINYNTTFSEGDTGVDIYRSSDLENWTAVGFVTTFGNNLEVSFPESAADQYYILVEPEKIPSFGSFDDSGIENITPE